MEFEGFKPMGLGPEKEEDDEMYDFNILVQ
jgi:hypothetical protein